MRRKAHKILVKYAEKKIFLAAMTDNNQGHKYEMSLTERERPENHKYT
jgi:hypothetical protein